MVAFPEHLAVTYRSRRFIPSTRKGKLALAGCVESD
jgi:hypothetical protein